jgi:hypothetical protein
MKHYYMRGPSGRLLDPVEGGIQTKKRPVVPSWLLPAIQSELPLHDLPDTALSQRLREYADFADVLAARGDCWRAQTEYERVAYVAQAREIELWARMRTGACYFRARDWGEAASHFSQAGSLPLSGTAGNTARFMTAASQFNIGNYVECDRTLSQCTFEGPADRTPPESATIEPEPGGVSAEDCLLLKGLSSMALGDWEVAAERFRGVSRTSPTPAGADMAEFLVEESRSPPPATT